MFLCCVVMMVKLDCGVLMVCESLVFVFASIRELSVRRRRCIRIFFVFLGVCLFLMILFWWIMILLFLVFLCLCFCWC